MGGAPEMRMVCYACLPGSTPGTVPETLGQRHCARGAAAGGMLLTRPFIRGRAPPTLAEGQPEAARGSRGRSPSCPSLVPFLGKQERNSLSVDYRQALRPPGGISKTAVGRLPTTSAARRAANPRPLSVDYRQTAPFDERQI